MVEISMDTRLAFPSFNPNHCTQCGTDVDPNCDCPRGRMKRAGEEIWKTTCLMLAINRAANKPKARLIKAYTRMLPGVGLLWPVRDTWVVYKEVKGCSIEGYGVTLDEAIAAFLSTYDLKNRLNPT